MCVILGGSRIPVWPCLLCDENVYSVRECEHHGLLRLLGCGSVVSMYCGLEVACGFW